MNPDTTQSAQTPGKHTPHEWAKLEGITIMDPDGWRRDGKSFDEPITREEYTERVNVSTICGIAAGATPGSAAWLREFASNFAAPASDPFDESDTDQSLLAGLTRAADEMKRLHSYADNFQKVAEALGTPFASFAEVIAGVTALRTRNAELVEALEACSVFVTPLEQLKNWSEYKQDAAERRRAALAKEGT